VTSKDGTRVPMFLAGRKGAFEGGPKPTLLYGYGGFNVSITPEFSAGRLAWLEAGGLYATACLRGAASTAKPGTPREPSSGKQNVFDDFIACAEWLIREGLTTSLQLGIQGESNGALLVGACLTQRPDLFGCALPGVGVMDMLRFHKFTIGWAWTSDYGSPDDPAEFAALKAYSPLHNLKPGTVYPATLVTTADTDDRVVPAHSYKFAAALQAAAAGTLPAPHPHRNGRGPPGRQAAAQDPRRSVGPLEPSSLTTRDFLSPGDPRRRCLLRSPGGSRPPKG
jgi:prolyl oligopeptidase